MKKNNFSPTETRVGNPKILLFLKKKVEKFPIYGKIFLIFRNIPKNLGNFLTKKIKKFAPPEKRVYKNIFF